MAVLEDQVGNGEKQVMRDRGKWVRDTGEDGGKCRWYDFLEKVEVVEVGGCCS